MLKVKVYDKSNGNYEQRHKIFCDTVTIHDISTSKKYVKKLMSCWKEGDGIKTIDVILDDTNAVTIEQYPKSKI